MVVKTDITVNHFVCLSKGSWLMSVNTARSKSPEIRGPSQARFFRRRPFEKCVADITGIPAKDRKLYVSAVFDCYDLSVPGLAMANNMRAELCISTVQNAAAWSRPPQRPWRPVTSALYREKLAHCGVIQRMSTGGRRYCDIRQYILMRSLLPERRFTTFRCM